MKIRTVSPPLLVALSLGCASQLTPTQAAVFVTTNPEVLTPCTAVGPVSTARDKEDQAGAFVIWPEGQSAGYNVQSASVDVIKARTAEMKANAVLLKPSSTTAEAYRCEADLTIPPAPLTPAQRGALVPRADGPNATTGCRLVARLDGPPEKLNDAIGSHVSPGREDYYLVDSNGGDRLPGLYDCSNRSR